MSGRDIERRRASAARAYADSLASVMATPAGRHLVWELLGKTGVHAPLMTGNNQTFYLVGRRDIGLELLGDVRAAALDDSRTMEDEAIARELRVAMEREAEDKRSQNQQENYTDAT